MAMRFTIFMATLIISIFLLAVALGEAAYAHAPSQGSAPWSQWRVVTWNSDYMLVRHRHFYDGTRCQLYDRYGNRITFKLVSKNANNRDCTG